MKATTILFALVAAAALTFSPLALHAQDDQQGPPPPMDNGAPPPPSDGSAPPPPDDGSAPPPSDQSGGDDNASFQQFYDNLSDQGQWIQSNDYGYVFQPNVQDPNWAPYTDGNWVYTDYGWTWNSDEPWGWATYHYGRWVNIIGSGWVWVPGYQWAPAWVSWRYGGGYCGWAPLPPATLVGVDFHFGGDVDISFGIGAGCYNFIPIGYIGESRYHGYYVDRGRNFTIINNTRNVTNINYRRGSGSFSNVTVGGPTLAQVNAQSRTHVQQVRLDGSGRAGVNGVSAGTLHVFTPHLNSNTPGHAQPRTVSGNLTNVQVNRGTSVTQPLQVNKQFKPAPPSASVVAAAKAAELKAPKSVATANRVTPTATPAVLQRQKNELVQHQENQPKAKTPTPNTPNRTPTDLTQHQNVTPGSGNSNTQVQHKQQVQQPQQQVQQQQQQQQKQEPRYTPAPNPTPQHTPQPQPQPQQHYQPQPQPQQHYQPSPGNGNSGGNHSSGGNSGGGNSGGNNGSGSGNKYNNNNGQGH